MDATKRQLAMLRSLRTKKGRKETGLFLVEGVRLCRELLASDVTVELFVVASDALTKAPVAELVEACRANGTPVAEAPPHAVEKVSDAVHGQGIVAAARWNDVALDSLPAAEGSVLVALDRVSDPGNVGTVIRTAAWFGAAGVVLGEGCADPLNPKAVRATMGAIFHLPVCRNVDLKDAVTSWKRSGFRIAAASADGDPNWRGWADASRSVLLLGSEAHGIEPALRATADMTVAIPRRGTGESLNVAITAGILLSACESTS